MYARREVDLDDSDRRTLNAWLVMSQPVGFGCFWVCLAVLALGGLSIAGWVWLLDNGQVTSKPLLAGSLVLIVLLMTGAIIALVQWGRERVSDRRPDPDVLEALKRGTITAIDLEFDAAWALPSGEFGELGMLAVTRLASGMYVVLPDLPCVEFEDRDRVRAARTGDTVASPVSIRFLPGSDGSLTWIRAVALPSAARVRMREALPEVGRPELAKVEQLARSVREASLTEFPDAWHTELKTT